MKQVAPILAALAVVGAFSTAVYAQTADRAIKYRQGIMCHPCAAITARRY